MSKWISVKDKLPALETKVLIWTTSTIENQLDEVEFAFLTDKGNNELGIIWFYPENHGWNVKDVTHWMPLPDAPEDE